MFNENKATKEDIKIVRKREGMSAAAILASIEVMGRDTQIKFLKAEIVYLHKYIDHMKLLLDYHKEKNERYEYYLKEESHARRED